MNDSEYKYFSELASTLNFSKAAKNLYISQPALSQCIVKLETEFGVKLLNRTKNTVSLTIAGETLLNEYPKVMFANYKMIQKLTSAKKDIHSIFIAIQNGLIINENLRQLFLDFESSHPNIELNFINITSSNVLNSLESDNIDLAITFNSAQKTNIEYDKIYLDSVETYIIVGNKNPILELDSYDKKIECLNESTLIIVDNNVMPNITSFVVTSCNKNGIFPKNIKYLKNNSSLCNNIILNKGFSIIYKDALINNDMLTYLPLKYNKLCDLCLFVKPNNHSEQIKILIDFIKEKIKQ